MLRKPKLNLYGIVLGMALPLFAQTYDLPLLVINTNGQNLEKGADKIPATIRIIDKGTNTLQDSLQSEPLKIGIKIRGQTSADFPKKGYAVEFWDDMNEGMDRPFLGLPDGEDWALHGPYVDKTLIRNALAMWLYYQTGRYSPRTRFNELYLNGQYKGVYLLIEKIKRGKYRVDVSKLKDTDNEGDDVSGGYIWSFDKVSNNSTTGIEQKGFMTNDGSPAVMRYPKREKMTDAQFNYIKNFVNEVEQTCDQGDVSSNGCLNIVDLNAFVDYTIHEDVTNNTDAYICSFYMFKPKDSKGGKLQLGAPWDFNLALGNPGYSNGMDIEGFRMENSHKSFPRSTGGNNMWAMTSSFFVADWVYNIWTSDVAKQRTKERWAELRSGVWHTKHIDHFIDSLKVLLKNAADRNFERWPVLGKASGTGDADPLEQNNNNNNNNGWNMWNMGMGMSMNGYSEQTWDAEIEHVRKYLKDRIAWLDSQYGFTEPATPLVSESISQEIVPDTITTSIRRVRNAGLVRVNYYTRTASSLTVHSQQGGRLALVGLDGRVLFQTRVEAGEQNVSIPERARNAHFIVTLDGKMLNP